MADEQSQHPDDAAVTQVREWVNGAHDEDLIELEARTLRGVLAVLDGWKQNAEGAAAQRNAAHSSAEKARIDMIILREDLAQAAAELEQLHTVLADPLESLQDLTEFQVTVMHATRDRTAHVRIDHVPCQTVVFGLPGDPVDLDADDLLERVATHQCDQAVEPRDVRQAISVETDDGTITAAIHGPQLLDHEGQEATADIVRAVIRKQRQDREDEARQRDEETRAIANLLFEAGKTSFRGFAAVGLVLTMAEVQMRFADRIADVQQRDAAEEANPGD